jgi:MFS family permease
MALTGRATAVPAFRLLWAGETLSVLGQQFSVLALPLLASLTLHASPAQMGLLVACETAPFLLFSLIAGVWVDRFPRRPLLVGMNLLRALVLGLVPLVVWLGGLQLEVLYLAAFLIGTFSIFFNVAYQSVLPAIVPSSALNDANGKMETSRAGAEVIGPGLAGTMIGMIGSVAALWINVGSFLMSALLLSRLRFDEHPVSAAKPPPIAQQMTEGLSFVWRHAQIRPLMLCAATLNAAQGLLDAVLVLYLSRSLHLNPLQIGLIYVGSNVGTVAGAVLSSPLAARLGVARAAVGAALIAGAGMLLVPIAGVAGSLNIAVLLLARFLYAFGDLMFFVQHITLRQSLTPPTLQGRMHASVRFLAGGVFPLAALLGGWTGQRLGIPVVLLLAGGIGSVAWLWVWRAGLPAVLPEPV